MSSTAFAHADAPLFLFHLLEYTNLPFELHVDALNARWAPPQYADPLGQLIIKHTDPQPLLLTEAPHSGAWQELGGGRIRWRFMQVHRRTVDDEKGAFFLRIAEPGTIVREGDDIGVLVMRGRLMDGEGQLTVRAKQWIEGIRREFVGIPIE